MKNVNKIESGRVFSYTRWSSDGQSAGDSERRQIELAQDWCHRNGRTLSQQRFVDSGVSGWRGDNRKTGALGALLKVTQPGDTILVEDPDRWSRENPLDSLTALRETVNRGVDVVFLKSGTVVSRANFNDPAVLIPNFFASFLANAENEKRASRIRDAMNVRRAEVEAGRAVKGPMPCWLKWDEALGKPVLIEEKAKVVRRIFEMSLSGMGINTIVQVLYHTPCITKGKKVRWNSRTVHRTLTDKSVIGYYCRGTGNPVPGVFPPVVSEADFYASCAKIKARATYTVRVAYRKNTLFTGLAKCSVCGGSLIKVRKVRSSGTVYDYLCCSNGVRQYRGHCKMRGKAIQYHKLEKAFVYMLAESDAARMALGSPTKENAELATLRSKLAEVEKQANKVMGLIDGDDNPPKRLLAQLKTLEQEENALRERVLNMERDAKAATPPVQAYDKFRREMVGRMKDEDFRVQVRNVLPDFINKVVVELGNDVFQVHFKGSEVPVTVTIAKNDVYSIVPALTTGGSKYIG